jgi:class 3 adenylate cyclase/predicted negative regulator of RcsB-dependent stress response/DNA polymerase III delta prime subunit
MDVAAWLQDLGLERYVPAFRDNDIDAEVLPKLTAEDLISLGVTSVGHRRKLLDAIASLGMAVPTAVVTAPAPGAPAQVAAERRQLTVMFCDLVGSTALSTRHDPEDLRELIADYHRVVSNTVGRFDGFVAKYMGDGVLIYFGYPQAHEDDAERAVRAGRAVIEAVGQLPAREDLSVRLGIATGLAVVGDLIGEGAAQERGVVGETPNLAARLQALAMPNTLVIAEATRRQVGRLFDLVDLGPQALAGFAEPQPAWRVIGESGMLSRFEALRSGTTPLVGRDEEVELLTRRWQQAKSGEGRVVLISGEPGIGKSRLTVALSEHIEAEPHTRLRYFCSPHHQDSALYPFIAQLERAAGFARDDTVDAKLGKLRTLLAPAARDDDDIALLSELLSLPSSAADLNLSPQRKREMLFEAFLHQLEAEARRRPVLMVFEDTHWIDPTSHELLDLTVDRVRHLPVLLAISFRPEFQPPWSGRPHVTGLALNRLGERDGEVLVQKLAGNAALTPDIVAEIVERTDGVPLFVEELTKAVLESAAQGDRVSAVLATTSLAAQSVPATLHASLIARLDRIGPTAKEIAQIGAVLGREFSYELIEPVAQRPEKELQAALDQLGDSGLLFCRGIPPHASYLFKHALVQDAAYGTLLRARRQELHARVATALEQHFADLVERQPEILAHHLTAAGEAERAVDQWLKAGQYAAARLAHLEAIRHFDRGLATLALLQEGPARDGRETELQLARGLSLFTAKGFISAEAAEAYARARELAERRGDAHQLFTAVFGLWQSTTSAGRILDCRGLSDRLQRLTADNADSELRLQAHHSAWTTHLFAGRPAAAREHCNEGRRLYNPERHQHHRLLYGGHDPGVCAGYVGAQVNWLLGYPERALAIGNESLVLAERIAHPFSLHIAQVFNAMLHLDRGEPELALEGLHAAEALAAEQRLGLVIAPGFLRGAALMAEGAFDDAIARLREGLAGRLGAMFAPYGRARLAEALTRQSNHEAALATVREALEEQERTGQRRWEPELHRVEGAAQQGLNRIEEAQSALEAALRIARCQQAKSYELRAATSLARLWGEQGRRAEARELLAPVYSWFTEGSDTADLKEAKALLYELA